VKAARPDQQRNCQVKRLPAGDYLAVALDYVEERAWDDPDFLEWLRRYTIEITVTEGQSQSVSLNLTTPDPQ
jgi:hypothetical protein